VPVISPQGAPARQDRRHARAHPAAVGKILDQRDLPDRDSGDVGERVQRPGRAVERDAEVAGARRAIRRGGSSQQASKQGERYAGHLGTPSSGPEADRAPRLYRTARRARA
jgi:hypothetical protein